MNRVLLTFILFFAFNSAYSFDVIDCVSSKDDFKLQSQIKGTFLKDLSFDHVDNVVFTESELELMPENVIDSKSNIRLEDSPAPIYFLGEHNGCSYAFELPSFQNDNIGDGVLVLWGSDCEDSEIILNCKLSKK
jgi:hypothetical protein